MSVDNTRKRKTSPRNYKVPVEKRSSGQRSNSDRWNKLWADPERKAALLAKRSATFARKKEAGIKSTRFGVPDGMRKDQAKWFWRQARFEATLTMKKLDKAGVLDDADEQAREALHHTLTVMRAPVNQALGLAAAKQVLEWTKAKPAQKSDVTINKAEEWLAAVTADNAQTDKGSTSSA